MGNFWPVFSGIRTEYGEIRRISRYSARIGENTDQKNPRIWTLFTQRVLKNLHTGPFVNSLAYSSGLHGNFGLSLEYSRIDLLIEMAELK